ncbi:putative ribonuclease H-like domain-containing protein [Tanacetum coccineum]
MVMENKRCGEQRIDMVKHDVEVESSGECVDEIDKLTEVSMKLINIGSMQVFDQFDIITILSTLDHLGKFDGKSNEGFLVGYSINSKAFRVFNSRTRKVEENLHVNFLENKSNVAGSGPQWLFDIDILTNTMNYHPVSAGNKTNGNAGLEINSDAGQAEREKVPDQEYILLPLLHTSSYIPSSSVEDKSSPNDDIGKKNEVKDPAKENDLNDSGEDTTADRTNRLNTGSSPVNSASSSFSYENQERPRDQRNEFENVFGQDKNAYKAFTPVNTDVPFDYPTDPLMPDLEDTDNLQSPGIFGNAYDDEDVGAAADMNNLETTMSVSPIPITRVDKDHPKAQILRELDSAVQTRRMHKTKEGLPYGKKAIGTKWVFRNKKDQRAIVVRNKAKLVAHGFRQEERIDYDEVFAHVARIEAIMLFLAYASYMDFTVYQMDVKSTFLYGTIKEEVYVCQPPGFLYPEFPDKVYKVEKALYGLHQAPRAWYETLSTYLIENGFRRGTIDKTLFIKKFKNDILLVQVYVDDIIFGSTKQSLSTEFEQLMHKRFQMSSMGELTFFLGLQVEQRADGIFLSQDKYVYEILKKFGYTNMKTASTPMETHNPLTKDKYGSDVDVHLYRYLKGQPTLGLLYPKDSPLELIAYSDSDYAGASIDRKSTTGGCQFLGCRLVSWKCKKQTIVAKSTTEAEYIAASNCYCYEKRLIEMVKIQTDYNVADLLTKAFDVTRKSMDLRMNGSCVSDFSHNWVHNMVAFLKKPTESEGFTEAVDFLKEHLLMGLNKYKHLLIKKSYTIIEASVRSKLQLADAAGISNLPDAEIYARLATLGYVSEGKLTFWKKNFAPRWKFIIDNLLHCISPKSGGWDQFGSHLATALICLSSNRIYNFSKLIFDGMINNIESTTKFLMYPRFLQMVLEITPSNTRKYLPKILTKKLFANIRRGYAGEFIPLLPVMLAGAAQVQDEATSTGVEVDAEGATTITTGLDTGLDSGNIHESLLMSYETPPQEGHTSRSVEDSMKLEKLMVLIPKLESKIGSLETELKDTKQTFGKAILILVDRVKTLETSGEEQVEDISLTTLEAIKTLSKVASQKQKPKSVYKGRRYKRRKESKGNKVDTSLNFEDTGFENISSGFEDISTGFNDDQDVNTGFDGINTGSLKVSTGKAPMIIEESPKKIKEQILQEEASLAEAIRLQTLKKEEIDKQVHLDALLAQRIAKEQELTEQQKQRKAQVQFEAQFYTKEDWDVIRAKLEANAELKESVLGKDLTEEDFAKKMVELVNQIKKHFAEERAKARRKVKAEFDKLVKQIESFVPMSFEATKANLKRFGEELQTKSAKRLKIGDKDAQSTKEKGHEAKEEEPVKKIGKRKKQIARKGLHTKKIAKDESEEDMDTSKKDNPSSGTNVPINLVPVATKPPSIADYKIIKHGKKVVYHIVRENRADKVYISFGAMLKDISRDDLTELYMIVMKNMG